MPVWSPAQDGAHPGQQFGEREGLHEVVIGTQFQPLDPIRHGITGRQEHHGSLPVGLADGAEYRPPIAARKLHVENDQVVVFGEGQVQAVVAAGGDIRREAAFRQALLQVARGFRFVLDNQDTHGACYAGAAIFKV